MAVSASDSDSRPGAIERQQMQAAMAAGYRLAAERQGRPAKREEAVWALLAEAAWVTRAVPDPDRRFRLGLRSNWPRVLVTASDALAARFARVGAGLPIQQEANRCGPTPEQISRAELVMTWWGVVRLARATVDRRDVVLAVFAMASGARPSVVARRFGVSRQSLYRWRDMAVAQIAGMLARELGRC